MQRHRLAQYGDGSAPWAGGALVLPHKRTADEEAPPISANTDPHFFRTYLNTVIALAVYPVIISHRA